MSNSMSTMTMGSKRFLHVQVRDAEGILERILMTTRRRGFRLFGCEVCVAAVLNHYDIVLQVESERPLSFLALQLQKLVDVVSVSSFAPEKSEPRHARRA